MEKSDASLNNYSCTEKDLVDTGVINEAIEVSNYVKNYLFELYGDYIPSYKQEFQMGEIISVISSREALYRPDLLDFGNTHYITDGICNMSQVVPKVTIVAFDEDFQIERWEDIGKPVGNRWIEVMKTFGISDIPSIIREYHRWNWIETIIHETVHTFQSQDLINFGKEKRFIECSVDFFVKEIGDISRGRSDRESGLFKYHEMTKDTIKLHILIFQRLLRDYGEDVLNLFFDESRVISSKKKIIDQCYQYYQKAISMKENSL